MHTIPCTGEQESFTGGKAVCIRGLKAMLGTSSIDLKSSMRQFYEGRGGLCNAISTMLCSENVCTQFPGREVGSYKGQELCMVG